MGQKLRCQSDLVIPDICEREDDIKDNCSYQIPKKAFYVEHPVNLSGLRNGKVIWRTGTIKERLGNGENILKTVQPKSHIRVKIR